MVMSKMYKIPRKYRASIGQDEGAYVVKGESRHEWKKEADGHYQSGIAIIPRRLQRIKVYLSMFVLSPQYRSSWERSNVEYKDEEEV
jgi:hypothetical protein